MVVHEIAHKWFYGVINNDPYVEAWLDEGFVSFAESLFHLDKTNIEIPYEKMYEIVAITKPLPVNLPLDQYEGSSYSSHTYGGARTMLWSLFEKRGGLEEAKKFIRDYYGFYKYKEVNTEEFIRFSQYYFDLEDASDFESWLEIEK